METKCAYCEKFIPDTEEGFEKWGGLPICDDCLEKKLMEESKEFDIYDEQHAKCFLCNKPMFGENISWTTRIIDGTQRAVCSECVRKLQ